MKKQYTSENILFVGFGFIGLFSVVFAVVWSYSLYDSQKRLTRISSQREEVNLVNKLKHISLKRNTTILRMIVTSDEFERDDEHMYILSLGEEFIRIRNKLFLNYFHEDEIEQWEQAAKYIKEGAKIQYKIFDLLHDGKNSEVIHLLNKLFQLQSNINVELNKLIDIVNANEEGEIKEAESTGVYFSYLVAFLLFSSVILSFIIAQYVVKKTKNLENKFRDYGYKLRELYNIVSESGIDDKSKVEVLLYSSCKLFNMDNAIVVEVNKEEAIKNTVYDIWTGNKLNSYVIGEIKNKLCDFSLYPDNGVIEILDYELSEQWAQNEKILKDINASISIPFKVNNESYGILFFLKKEKHNMKLSVEECDLVKLVSSWIGFSIGREVDTKRLRYLKEVAEHASNAKTDFLGNMSHELRTPMHAILSYSRFGVKRFSTASDEKKLSYFKRINNSAESLLTLLNDILDLGELEENKMEFHIEYNNINNLILDVVSEFSAMLQDKKLLLEYDHKQKLSPIKFDEGRMRQVIRNLVSNAIKFSEKNSVISIQCENQPNLFIFHIIDQGIGIPEDELIDIFDKFKQSSKTKTGAGGTGLGLAISRQIIDAHKGQIWAENNSGCGSIFSFSIPIDIGTDEYKQVI